MKVISEHIIKKLIKEKLLENYKKKLLTEDVDEDSIDFKNQIISSGVIEALWLFFNNSRYEDKLGILGNLKNNMSNKFNDILSSQSLTDFTSKINNLINEFINLLKDNQALANSLLSSHPLFTNLLAYNDLILQKFNEKLSNITTANAYTQYNDINIISNHISGGITYEGAKVLGKGIDGIKDNILEILNELLGKSPQILTIEQVQQKIKNLLPIATINLNTNNINTPEINTQNNNNNQQPTTSVARVTNTAFSRIKGRLNLSSRQMQKLGRTIVKIANARTNNDAEKQKYQQLLLIFTAAKTQNNSSAIEKVAEQIPEEKAGQLKQDAEKLIIKGLQDKQKTSKVIFNYGQLNWEDKNWLKKIKNLKTLKTRRDKIGLRNISYYYFTWCFLDQSKDNKSKVNAIKSDITILEELSAPNLLVNLNNEEVLINLGDEATKNIKAFFDKINSTDNDYFYKIVDASTENSDISAFGKLVNWIKAYFNNERITGKYITIDYNFITYIKLKYLSEILNLKGNVKEALNQFERKRYDIADTPEAAEAAQVQETTASTSQSADTSTTATTKDCFKNNNDNNKHTNNFKLYPADKIAPAISKPSEYRLKIAEYLLNNSAPDNYGFINKNVDEKNFVKDKLKSLTENQIAEALLKLYPNATTKKSNEYWRENYYININADEIIAATKTP
jgi:hypothetical protein